MGRGNKLKFKPLIFESQLFFAQQQLSFEFKLTQLIVSQLVQS